MTEEGGDETKPFGFFEAAHSYSPRKKKKKKSRSIFNPSHPAGEDAAEVLVMQGGGTTVRTCFVSREEKKKRPDIHGLFCGRKSNLHWHPGKKKRGRGILGREVSGQGDRESQRAEGKKERRKNNVLFSTKGKEGCFFLIIERKIFRWRASCGWRRGR